MKEDNVKTLNIDDLSPLVEEAMETDKKYKELQDQGKGDEAVKLEEDFKLKIGKAKMAFYAGAVDKVDHQLRINQASEMHLENSLNYWTRMDRESYEKARKLNRTWMKNKLQKVKDHFTKAVNEPPVPDPVKAQAAPTERMKPKVMKKEAPKDKPKDQKLIESVKAGSKVVEKSLSKVAWDVGQDKIQVTQGKLNYKSHRVLDTCADKVAKGTWLMKLTGENFWKIGSQQVVVDRDGECYMVIVTASEYREFISKPNLSNIQVCKDFEALPEIVLKGDLLVPIAGSWITITGYKDNICGLLLAHEGGDEAEAWRSKRKQRGRGAGEEEPVFILLFSNAYGKAWFKNAMNREDTQLQGREIYTIEPGAQDIFFAQRWYRDMIILDAEIASRILNLKWPTSNLRERVMRVESYLEILYTEGYITKPTKKGKHINRRTWIYWIAKRHYLNKQT